MSDLPLLPLPKLLHDPGDLAPPLPLHLTHSYWFFKENSVLEKVGAEVTPLGSPRATLLSPYGLFVFSTVTHMKMGGGRCL